MRKITLSALSLSLVCLLALVGCKPTSDKASTPGAPPAAPSAQTMSAPQSTNVQQSNASPMSPGLWEITIQSDQMRQQPQMSPQQAEQMRKMGITVPETRNGGMVMKVCYTKELLEKSAIPASQNEHECKPTNMSRNGNSFTSEVVCNGPNMKGTGTSSGTMSNTSYQITTSFTGTMGGQPANHKSQMSGNYLGADCGNVKPIGTR
jgi:hypothetical protein